MSLFVFALAFFAMSGIVCASISAVINVIQGNHRAVTGSILGAFGPFAALIGVVWLHVSA